MNILKITVLFAICTALVSCRKYKRKDGKLLLNPIELVDLIAEENYVGLPSAGYRTKKFTYDPTSDLEDITTATKEPMTAEDIQQTLEHSSENNTNSKPDVSDPSRVYHPVALQESQLPDDIVQRTAMNPAYSLTKLARSFNFGVDPFFSKGYFGPFERRQRPVTLVAFRKNGFLPKLKLSSGGQSAEIAELQSPFNVVSDFWADFEEPTS